MHDFSAEAPLIGDPSSSHHPSLPPALLFPLLPTPQPQLCVYLLNSTTPTLFSTLLILCSRHADFVQTYNVTQHGGNSVPDASLLSSRPLARPCSLPTRPAEAPLQRLHPSSLPQNHSTNISSLGMAATRSQAPTPEPRAILTLCSLPGSGLHPSSPSQEDASLSERNDLLFPDLEMHAPASMLPNCCAFRRDLVHPKAAWPAPGSSPALLPAVGVRSPVLCFLAT